jgi:rhamnulose-1-phosphate aldolase/alcohol dehydrogenase
VLDLAKLRALRERYRGPDFEDELVPLLAHCALVPGAPPSIDTLLHAFLPAAHVDHLHPDAVLALGCARDGERATREAFGGRVGWLEWRRPGAALAFEVEGLVRREPSLEGIVLARHGLLSWGATSRECFERSKALVACAEEFVAKRARGPRFGGTRIAAAPPAERRALAARLLPILRGKLSRETRRVGRFDDSELVLEFASGQGARELAARGTSCPDHFLRTKRTPLFLDFDPAREGSDDLALRLDPALARYRDEYRAYYERCRRADSPALRDPEPAVVVVPGIGVFAFGRDAASARIAGEFFAHAIRAMDGASALGGYEALAEQAAFDVEYWALEQAKLDRLPPERALARRVALVTGGAGGIGRASARRLLAEGASVVTTDLDRGALADAARELAREFGADAVLPVEMDVTSEASVADGFAHAARHFGGVDVVVCSAGLASAAPVVDTTLELWRLNFDVLATGYFLVAREAFRLLRAQGIGGSIVFVGSKNALAASPNASAYSAAKAAELHLARSLALEGGPHGIRVNVVNPDAVLAGSRIWDSDWRRARAEAYGIAPEDLERHYRERSLLQASVLPEDVAEAVLFFASDRSAKSTGNLLNVDAGNAAAFPR